MRLASIAGLLVLIGGATVVSVWSVWSMPAPASDRLALMSVVLAGSTVVLTVLGSLVALAAYAAATQRPDLVATVTFRFSFPDEPVLELEDGTEDDPVHPRAIRAYRQTEARVTITNKSGYSARNPALTIQLIGWGGIIGSPGWVATHFASTVGPTAVQWEGGADYAIHGNWTRELPVVEFGGSRVYGGQTEVALELDLVADGFHSVRRIPVRLLDSADYATYSEKRRARFDGEASRGRRAKG